MSSHIGDDCVYFLGDSDILFSMPHAVNQTRLGKRKYPEPGTVGVGLTLADRLNASYIVKTMNNFDDANFDEKCNYRDKIKYILSVKGIKYLIDIHGLSKSRECDINLGINYGANIQNNVLLYDKLERELRRAGFNVTIDNPFSAPTRTISGYFAEHYSLWTIQLEINSKITNESKYIKEFNTLIDVLTNVLKSLEK